MLRLLFYFCFYFYFYFVVSKLPGVFLGRGVFVIISLHMLLCIIMREFNVFSVTCQ
jgi:hypothetical protein